MSIVSERAAAIAKRTWSGINAAESDNHTPVQLHEAHIADSILSLALLHRNQEIDDDALVALLDSLRDGSSPVIAREPEGTGS